MRWWSRRDRVVRISGGKLRSLSGQGTGYCQPNQAVATPLGRGQAKDRHHRHDGSLSHFYPDTLALLTQTPKHPVAGVLYSLPSICSHHTTPHHICVILVHLQIPLGLRSSLLVLYGSNFPVPPPNRDDILPWRSAPPRNH